MHSSNGCMVCYLHNIFCLWLTVYFKLAMKRHKQEFKERIKHQKHHQSTRMFIIIIIATFATAVLNDAPRYPISCNGDQIECLADGNTLSNIAEYHGLDSKKLKDFNLHIFLPVSQIADSYDMVFAGDRVCIPKVLFPQRPSTECNGDFWVRVETGDTLYAMAVDNSLSHNSLVDANSHLGPSFDLLLPGDQVCVPNGITAFEGESIQKPDFKFIALFRKSESPNNVELGYYEVCMPEGCPVFDFQPTSVEDVSVKAEIAASPASVTLSLRYASRTN
jgi:LysM repeat protein